jgi:RNA polymerase sigma-70 factor, ECF subfamily
MEVILARPTNVSEWTGLLELTDEQVLARIRAGQTWCFELLMRRHNQRMFRAIRAILKRDDEAEDVVQEAYVRAYEHLAEFRGDASFGTWVMRIAVHEALGRARRQARSGATAAPAEEAPAMPTALSRTPEQLVSDQQLRVVLEKAIDALPDEFRIVFVMRAVEQMSGVETAACLGIPEDTVKTRLYRARLKLQESVSESLAANCERSYEFHRSRCDRIVSAVLRRLGISPASSSIG